MIAVASERPFRIDAARLIEVVAEASGFQGSVETIAPGLWSVGRLPSGRTVAVAVNPWVLDQSGIVLMLKAAGGAVTMLAPDPGQRVRLRFLEAGIDLVELRSALKPSAHGVDVLDRGALEPKPNRPRLSIDVAAQAVLIDGTPQRVPAQPFKLLTLLAQEVRNGAGPVRSRAIEDATGRDTRDLVRELRDALSLGRPNASELRKWIEARRSLGAFELVLEPEQIEIAR